MKSNEKGVLTAFTALIVAGTVGWMVSCAGVPLLAPSGSTISAFAQPESVAAHGGVSVINAIVVSPEGLPVHDGTVVQFFSNIGTVDREAKTNGGVARANFIADDRSGDANIQVCSGGVATVTPVTTVPGTTTPPTTTTFSGTGSTVQALSTTEGTPCDEVTVRVGNVNVDVVFIRAEPSRLTTSRSTHVIATVYDSAGNPVPNVPVMFSVGQPGLEFVESQGRPVFTNNNGEAADVAHTREDCPASNPCDDHFKVTATVPTGQSATVNIGIALQ